ncbi:MAG: toxin-antitoxin system HicB family antitoxin [Myxococcaceae bacterium]
MKMNKGQLALASMPYCRVLIPDESGGFSAEVLEMPGCLAQGETAEEAFRNLESAMQSWVEALVDQGGTAPAPIGDVDASGRLLLRLPKSFHRRAALLAEKDGISLNQFVVNALAEQLGVRSALSQIDRTLGALKSLFWSAFAPLRTGTSSVRKEAVKPTKTSGSDASVESQRTYN